MDSVWYAACPPDVTRTTNVNVPGCVGVPQSDAGAHGDPRDRPGGSAPDAMSKT